MSEAGARKRVRGELLRRQSIDRFDRVRSARIIADYNRMSVACPQWKLGR